MRKQLFYVIGILIFGLSSTACSKNEAACDPEDKESPCYIATETIGLVLWSEHRINNELVGKFEYDHLNRRTKFTPKSGSIEYKYNGNNQLLTTIYKNDNNEVSHREDYTYGSGNSPASMVISSPGEKNFIPIDVSFIYEKNKITQIAVPRDKNPQIITTTYTFNEQSNLTQLLTESEGIQTINNWSDFDNKPSAAINGDPYHWKNGKNNAGRFTVSSLSYKLDQKWVFTYNNEGFPIKALVYNNGSSDVAEEHQFTYIKGK